MFIKFIQLCLWQTNYNRIVAALQRLNTGLDTRLGNAAIDIPTAIRWLTIHLDEEGDGPTQTADMHGASVANTFIDALGDGADDAMFQLIITLVLDTLTARYDVHHAQAEEFRTLGELYTTVLIIKVNKEFTSQLIGTTLKKPRYDDRLQSGDKVGPKEAQVVYNAYATVRPRVDGPGRHKSDDEGDDAEELPHIQVARDILWKEVAEQTGWWWTPCPTLDSEAGRAKLTQWQNVKVVDHPPWPECPRRLKQHWDHIAKRLFKPDGIRWLLELQKVKI